MIDRARLTKIEALANEVLRTQEDLVDLDRQRNGRREGLGCFRRGEVTGQTQWIATEGQFLRLPTSCAQSWLTRQQESSAEEVERLRGRLRSQAQDLLRENPKVTELPTGVCEFLLQERRQRDASATAGAAEASEDAPPERRHVAERAPEAAPASAPAPAAARSTTAAAAAPKAAAKKNALDYSRFDRIEDSDSDF
eukprot:TRINITY_DN2047_c0_g9_i1.p1 TRINITY_DN2047_c0_g9~~TRINITY_DN2047_c0_g9_i1.p1  ORF type:complete len:226 (+),score=52.22 TRINITY_DN2047_c0_g9_i1:91-678(+)